MVSQGTLDLGTITQKSENVYEAVLIIAKRARAITAERKAKELLNETSYESTVEMEEAELKEDTEEKAIVLAMDDFFNNRLEVRYKVEEEEIIQDEEEDSELAEIAKM